MLEVGWSELLVIAIVMIVVVGPKDLPKMLRTFATFVKKARGMANDFQSQFTDAMRDAELDELRKTLADVRSLSPKNALQEAFDPIRKAGEDIKRDMEGLKTEVTTGADNAISPVNAASAAPAAAKSEIAPQTPTAAAAKPARKPRAKKPEPEA